MRSAGRPAEGGGFLQFAVRAFSAAAHFFLVAKEPNPLAFSCSFAMIACSRSTHTGAVAEGPAVSPPRPRRAGAGDRTARGPASAFGSRAGHRVSSSQLASHTPPASPPPPASGAPVSRARARAQARERVAEPGAQRGNINLRPTALESRAGHFSLRRCSGRGCGRAPFAIVRSRLARGWARARARALVTLSPSGKVRHLAAAASTPLSPVFSSSGRTKCSERRLCFRVAPPAAAPPAQGPAVRERPDEEEQIYYVASWPLRST